MTKKIEIPDTTVIVAQLVLSWFIINPIKLMQIKSNIVLQKINILLENHLVFEGDPILYV